jgi:hypothetical protein
MYYTAISRCVEEGQLGLEAYPGVQEPRKVSETAERNVDE